MHKHFNLFYLLLEDKERNKMIKEKFEETKRIIEEFYVKIRQNRPALPHGKDKEHGKEQEP